MIETLIKNAEVYDGTGGDPIMSDIGISGGMIEFVAPGALLNAETVIDASGLAACPGFIDVHGHSEFSLVSAPEAQSKLLQGITTEVAGNCGFSAAPIFNAAVGHMEKEFITHGILKPRWSTFAQYRKRLLDARPGINLATLAGHGNLRASVIGYENRPATDDDLKAMAELLRQAVLDGARGLSTGLIYSPGVYCDTDELIALIERSGSGIGKLIYTTHMRSEGDRLIESVAETLEIARRTGIAVHLSHLKTAGKHNWHKIDALLGMLQEARATGGSGLRVTCDRYPYTASQTSLDTVLPAWVYEGGDEAELARLSNPETLERIMREIKESGRTQDGYWGRVMVGSVGAAAVPTDAGSGAATASSSRARNRAAEGRTIEELARVEGFKNPLDYVIKLLIEERLKVDAIFFSMSEDNLRRILALPFCMIGTDSTSRNFPGGPASPGGIIDESGGHGKPHPRGFGSFPRFFGKYVRSEGLMPLKEAVRKTCGLPAEVFNLSRRGFLKAGYYADLVLFNKDEIIDTALYESPYSAPRGIDRVFVNGREAVRHGNLTGERAGMVL
jgi:N-acyl-D-amino-acid deacylase